MTGLDPKREFTIVCYRASQRRIDLVCLAVAPALFDPVAGPVAS